MPIKNEEISIVILAGGQGQRMSGQNKGLLPLMGKPMIAHVIQRLPTGVNTLISANADIDVYSQFGLAVIPDVIAEPLGPLNGIYSAFLQTTSEWLLTVPCDTPKIPNDYFSRMTQATTAKAYVANDGQRAHNGCCRLHRSLLDKLLSHLEQRQLALHAFLQHVGVQGVDFSDQAEAFVNINTAQELQQLAATADDND